MTAFNAKVSAVLRVLANAAATARSLPVEVCVYCANDVADACLLTLRDLRYECSAAQVGSTGKMRFTYTPDAATVRDAQIAAQVPV